MALYSRVETELREAGLVCFGLLARAPNSIDHTILAGVFYYVYLRSFFHVVTSFGAGYVGYIQYTIDNQDNQEHQHK